MKTYYKPLVRRITIFFGIALILLNTAVAAADPQSSSEMQALNQYPNWVGYGCSSGSGSGPVSISGETTGPPKAVEQVVWNTLTSGGIDDIHTAAVMGNIAHEGGFIPENSSENPDAPDRSKDPTVTGDGYGYGLIGWTPGKSLLAQMKEMGMGDDPPYTAETQAAVILGDIQGKAPDYYAASLGQDFLKTKTVEDATSFFEGPGGFENPKDPDATRQARINSAQTFMKEFGGSGDVSGTTDTGSDSGSDGSGGCCAGSLAGAGDTSVNDVYILGDSITERAQDAYKQAFQQYNAKVDIDASVSRGINSPGTTGNKLSGLQAIGHDQDEIQKADTVVVALGTNGGATTEDIDKVIGAIQGINPGAAIYWVNIISVGRNDNFNQNITGPTNQALHQEASSQGYDVIPWFNKVDPDGKAGQPTKSEKDPNHYIDNSDSLGVHPTTAGSKALADMVVKYVGADQNNSAASGCCDTGTGGSGASGTISPAVGKGMTPDAQTKFQQILVAAAQKANIDPNYLAAFYFEENNTDQLAELKAGTAKWREPAPPYGDGDSWPPEHNGGVTGPFQIQQGNIPADGVDGNGDGTIDLNDLTDAAYTAANYLKNAGASVNASDDKLYAAALSYNHADWYATIIMNIYKFLSNGGQSTVSGSGGDCSSSGASGSVQSAVQAAKLLSSYQIPYTWGGLHTTGDLNITDPKTLKKTGADCSGSVSWVLHQAGMFKGTGAIESGDFSTWGEAGPGQQMTIWENTGHVFIEFNLPGGHYELNTSYGTANGLPSGSGPQYFKWESGYTTKSGFTARHFKGT